MSQVVYSNIFLRKRRDVIRFICATENNQPCWFYIKIHPEKFWEYESKMKKGTLNIRDYGEVLESGWGRYPAPDVARFMRDEYDFDTPAIM